MENKAQTSALKPLKFAVFGINEEGVRDGLVVSVDVSKEEIENKHHYRKAEFLAAQNGIKFPVSVCETDPAFRLINETVKSQHVLILNNSGICTVQASPGVEYHVVDVDSMSEPYCVPKAFESLTRELGVKYEDFDYLAEVNQSIIEIGNSNPTSYIEDKQLAERLGMMGEDAEKAVLHYVYQEETLTLKLCNKALAGATSSELCPYYVWVDSEGIEITDKFTSLSVDANEEINALLSNIKVWGLGK